MTFITLSLMRLSIEAIKNLGTILTKEVDGIASNLTNDELNEIGELFLTVLAESLKIEK